MSGTGPLDGGGIVAAQGGDGLDGVQCLVSGDGDGDDGVRRKKREA